MDKYRLVRITNNPEENPKYAADSLVYPHLVECLDDESDLFIIRVEDGASWQADEFFNMAGFAIREFQVTEIQS